MANSAFAFDSEGRLRRRSEKPVPRDHLNRLKERFVAPDGYSEAKRLLAEFRMVVVRGEPGSGRTTTARVLLATAGDDSALVREFVGEDLLPEEGTGASPDRWNLERGERLLLDLSGADGRLLTGIRPILSNYWEAVREHGAYLAVVLDSYRGLEIGEEFRSLLVSVSAPDRLQVLRRHLGAERLFYSEKQLQDAKVVEWAARAKIGEIGELVFRIRDARKKAPEAPPEEWLARALDHVPRRDHEVEEQLARLTDGWERALLLSAAMLEGSRADAVFGATQKLVERVEASEPEAPRWEWPGFTARLTALGARIAADRTVAFDTAGYAGAVRDRFWDDHPDLGEQLRLWVDDCVRLPRLSGADRDRIAERFTRQALRSGQVKEVFQQVEEWAAKNSSGSSLAPQAAYALSEALRHDQSSRTVRRKVREWARDDTLPAALAQVLVTVSEEEIAVNWPDQALVRLHHLARHREWRIRRDATDALLRLVERPFLYRLLLHRITASLRHHHQDADAALLWEVTAPERLGSSDRGRPLIGDPRVRSQVTEALGRVVGGEHELARHADRWLSAHVGGADPLLLDVLAEAAHRAGRDVRLYSVALRWVAEARQEERALRARTVRRLTDRIDEFQGLFSPEKSECLGRGA